MLGSHQRLATLIPADQLRTVRQRIDAYIDAHVLRTDGIDRQVSLLWKVAGEGLQGGKLVRPAILLATAHAARGTDSGGNDSDGHGEPHHLDDAQTEALLGAAVAIELLHGAFLLHDDVIDRDVLRRGEPNLLGRVDDFTEGEITDPAAKTRLGQAAAILIGDVMLADAHQRIGRLRVDHDVRIELLDLLAEALTHSVEGEYADVRYAVPGADPSIEQVLAMSASKTAAYTISLPILFGLALTGTAAPRAQLSEFTHALGLAFQLQDDLLGVFGNPEEVGKDPFSDIREGKFTALVAHARVTAQWPDLAPLLGCEGLTADQGAVAISLLEQSGARAAVQAELDHQLARAAELVREIAVANPALADMLDAVVTAIAERRS